MGAKKLPVQMKKTRGTSRKDRDNPKQPDIVKIDSSVPDWLCEVGKNKFIELKAVFEKMKILSQSDYDMLAKMCDSWSIYQEARSFIKTNGTTYTTQTAQGDIMHRPRPQYAIMEKERAALIKMMSDFGMSPASRQRVQMIGDDNSNPLSKI